MNLRILLCSFFLAINVCHGETLKIETPKGVLELQIETATTPDSQRKGLMFRDVIPDKTGMLFIYKRPKILRMWMKNTYVSLDMLFIDAKGIVFHIHEKAEPLSLKTIFSPKPAKAVLEIKGGQARELGISIGDRLHHPAFSAQ